MKRYAIIGVAGYVAPRHLQAIQDIGGKLVAALDKSDSVGILDKYFPEAAFFTEAERFERYLNKLRLENKGIDYLVVCSPNYLHDAHCRMGLHLGADVICEKPLVLNPHNLDVLKEAELASGKKIFTILQLRLHPALKKLKESLSDQVDIMHDVRMQYITPRGKWYHYSWKGDVARSGGLATNLGIHLFDLLIWLFGNVKQSELRLQTPDRMEGYLHLERARVDWMLSIRKEDLPEEGLPHYRVLTIDGKSTAFGQGFTELHTASYQAIQEGKGFGIEVNRPAIALVASMR
jgi:UDP-N-acetyl-2-amino-2-deoxyglucuronate dehydrogenase